MTFKFNDLLPDLQSGSSGYDKANWALCGAGDVVKLPNVFSYRVVYFNRIMKAAKFQAAYLGVTLSIHQEGDFINFEFRKVEAVGEPRYTHWDENGRYYEQLPPRHLGSGYPGEDKICPYPATFGKITSINFYKNGDDTE